MVIKPDLRDIFIPCLRRFALVEPHVNEIPRDPAILGRKPDQIAIHIGCLAESGAWIIFCARHTSGGEPCHGKPRPSSIVDFFIVCSR
jgi:hypothetical protein